MLSTFGALNGSIMASPRVWYAMANDGLFFRALGAVHPRNRTPYVALPLNMCLGLIAVFTHTFEQLTRIFVLGRWPFITLAVATVFVVPRRRPELAALCHRLGYPFVPAAFILFSVAMLGNELYRSRRTYCRAWGSWRSASLVFFGSRLWRLVARSRRATAAPDAARP